jgi:hypothetical protein
MIEKYTKVFELLGKIKPLIDRKIDFPEELDLSKDFYDLVHDIGQKNIRNCEKIIDLSIQVSQNLEELKDQFEDSEYKLLKSTCKKTIEYERREVDNILDLLIGIDKMVKYWQKFTKDPHNPTDYECSVLLSHEVNPDILEIDVI